MAKRELVKRFVYTEQPITEFHDVSQRRQQTPGKPNGLWYSCGRSWINWLSRAWEERFRKIQYEYELIIDFTDVLVIRNERELVAFSEAYGIPDRRSPIPGTIKDIDWQAVARSYTGIEICPFLGKGNLLDPPQLDWYDWDVASGCIWDVNDAVLEAIESDFTTRLEDYEPDDELDYIYGRYESPYKPSSSLLSQVPSLSGLALDRTSMAIRERFYQSGNRHFKELADQMLQHFMDIGLTNDLELIDQQFLAQDIDDAIIVAYKPDMRTEIGRFRVVEKVCITGEGCKPTGRRITVGKRITPVTTLEFDFYPKRFHGNPIEQVGITVSSRGSRTQQMFDLNDGGIGSALRAIKRWANMFTPSEAKVPYMESLLEALEDILSPDYFNIQVRKFGNRLDEIRITAQNVSEKGSFLVSQVGSRIDMQGKLGRDSFGGDAYRTRADRLEQLELWMEAVEDLAGIA